MIHVRGVRTVATLALQWVRNPTSLMAISSGSAATSVVTERPTDSFWVGGGTTKPSRFVRFGLSKFGGWQALGKQAALFRDSPESCSPFCPQRAGNSLQVGERGRRDAQISGRLSGEGPSQLPVGGADIHTGHVRSGLAHRLTGGGSGSKRGATGVRSLAHLRVGAEEREQVFGRTCPAKARSSACR